VISEKETLELTCRHEVLGINLSTVTCSIRKNDSNWNVGHDSLYTIATMARPTAIVPHRVCGLCFAFWDGAESQMAVLFLIRLKSPTI
jgi:hypothetical protein